MRCTREMFVELIIIIWNHEKMLAKKRENINKYTSFKIYVSLHCKLQWNEHFITTMHVNLFWLLFILMIDDDSFMREIVRIFQTSIKIIVKLLFLRLNGQDYFLWWYFKVHVIDIYLQTYRCNSWKYSYFPRSSPGMKRVFVCVDNDKLFAWK